MNQRDHSQVFIIANSTTRKTSATLSICGISGIMPATLSVRIIASSQSSQTAAASTSKQIKNTFAPRCKNEYFTPGSLFSLCKYGFPFEDLPEKGKKMVLEYSREYAKRCTRTGDKVEFPPFPSGPSIIV